MHIVIWVVAALLLGMWTLLAWGLHALVGIDLSALGSVAGALDNVPAAPWFDEWTPGWRDLMVSLAELVQVSLSWAGAVLPGLVWVIWGLGALGLVLCAVLASAAVALLRRAFRNTPPPAGPGFNAGSAAPR